MQHRFWGGLLFLMTLAAQPAEAQVTFTRAYANSELRLTLIAPEIVRVQVIPRGASTEFPRIQLVQKQPPTRDRWQIRDAGDVITLRGSKLRVRVDKKSPRVDFLDAQGAPLSLDSEGASPVESTFQDTRAINANEEFFGFGLQFHSLAQRGKTKTLKVNADPSTDIGNSHAVVPFFLSTAGYGIFLDSHGYTHFDLGKTNPTKLVFQSPDPVLDYYFCYGPNFHDLLARYTQLTGRMALPPKWGLGFWYRMKSGWDGAKVDEVASAFREHNVPCDVIGLEPSWQTHSYSCSYVWNTHDFPDPKAFVAGIREKHFHLNLWEHAYVHPTSPIHDALQKAHVVGDKEVWGGLVPDFTRPEASQLFSDLHHKAHIDLGVDGYKLDECDGSDFTGGWFFPDDTKFPSGMTGAQMHNVFGYLYQKTFHDWFDAENKRSYFLVRGMFAGGQAYPSVIYSDWYGFPEYVRACANSGFSGILWCPEVRQTENPDEFVRRFQTVFFSPLAMINAWADGVTPWEKGPQIESIFRTYAGLRMQLTPYLYSAFWQMHETGLPIVRALVMDSPEDRNTYSVEDAYLYGDSFLVAPVLSGTRRNVYLPKGTWTDWWTGETYKGGQTIEVQAPVERLPLFVKGGALIPLQPAMNYAGEKPVTALTVRVYPGATPSAFTLYDDDGETLNYRKSENVRVRLTCTPGKGELLLRQEKPQGTYAPAWKNFVWEVHNQAQEPKSVLIGSHNIVQVSAETWDSAETGYRYDAETRTLRVKTSYPDTQTIRIRE